MSSAGQTSRTTSPETLARYLAAADAANTRRAYESDVRSFIRWGGTIPSTDRIVASNLVDHAQRLAPSTLSRRLIGIGHAHVIHGDRNPCETQLVRAAMRGIWRVHGRPQRQVRPLLREHLLAMLPLMIGVKGLRDRGLLLVGFAAALRRSELVVLRVADVQFVSAGMTLMIKRSKTDQSGAGRKLGIAYANSAACPVTALANWLAHAQIRSGPIFRAVTKHGEVASAALSPQSVACIVKEYAGKTELDATKYSGHSLRAGLATSAALAGVSSWRIRRTTGHNSDAMLQRYIRDAEMFDNSHAASVL